MPFAVWETSPDRRFAGIGAIRSAVQDQWRTFPIMQHATANHIVDIDGSWRIAYGRVVRPFDLAPLAPADGPGEVNAIPG